MCIFNTKMHIFRRDVYHFFLTTRRKTISKIYLGEICEIAKLWPAAATFFMSLRKMCGVHISAKREIGRKNSDGMAVKNRQNIVRRGWFLKIPYACRFG